jgi:hypothetical protein
MPSITSGEMADCDWQKRNFSGPLFSRNGPGCPLRKNGRMHFKKTAKLIENLKINNIIYIVLFVETPRKFITAKLSIRKPGSSSVLINMCGVSTNKNVICVV